VKDFEAFLKKVKGLKLSRAYDLLRLAGGRTTDEELRKDARERKQKSRAKKRTPLKPTPALPKTPKADQKVFDSPQEAHAVDSVTKPDVTESLKPKVVPKWVGDAEQSSKGLAEFAFACRTYLPRITVEAEREEARRLVTELLSDKAEAA
jgi:hypothetical protein